MNRLLRDCTSAASSDLCTGVEVRIELSPEQVERLNNLTPAAGERHDEANMAVIDR